jgi:hypothetical protein
MVKLFFYICLDKFDISLKLTGSSPGQIGSKYLIDRNQKCIEVVFVTKVYIYELYIRTLYITQIFYYIYMIPLINY